MPEREQNEEFVRQYFEAVWNRRDDAAIDGMMSRDCVLYGLPDPDAVLRGVEQFRAVHGMFCSAFPDLHIAVEDVIASGDRVAARWVATGTHLGDQLGFPATGKAASLAGATIGVVRDGQLAEAWNMMDMGHLFDMLRGEPTRF